MDDGIFDSFARESLAAARAMVARTGGKVLLRAEEKRSPRRFVAEFRCKTLIKEEGRAIVEANRSVVGIYWPPAYLRTPMDPAQVFCWIGPVEIFNCHVKAPFICPGSLAAGADLCTCLSQLYRIISGQTLATHDALNPEAAAWALAHMDRYPIDPRPMLERAPLEIEMLSSPKKRSSRERSTVV